MRQGIPMAGNHLVQELALITGAVEAMVVDYQCIMPSLGDLAACYHTKVVHHLPQGQVPRAPPTCPSPRKMGGAGPGTGGRRPWRISPGAGRSGCSSPAPRCPR